MRQDRPGPHVGALAKRVFDPVGGYLALHRAKLDIAESFYQGRRPDLVSQAR